MLAQAPRNKTRLRMRVDHSLPAPIVSPLGHLPSLRLPRRESHPHNSLNTEDLSRFFWVGHAASSSSSSVSVGSDFIDELTPTGYRRLPPVVRNLILRTHDSQSELEENDGPDDPFEERRLRASVTRQFGTIERGQEHIGRLNARWIDMRRRPEEREESESEEFPCGPELRFRSKSLDVGDSLETSWKSRRCLPSLLTQKSPQKKSPQKKSGSRLRRLFRHSTASRDSRRPRDSSLRSPPKKNPKKNLKSAFRRFLSHVVKPRTRTRNKNRTRMRRLRGRIQGSRRRRRSSHRLTDSLNPIIQLGQNVNFNANRSRRYTVPPTRPRPFVFEPRSEEGHRVGVEGRATPGLRRGVSEVSGGSGGGRRRI